MQSLRAALTGGGPARSFGTPCKTTDRGHVRIPVSVLDDYARQRWEAVLGYMVGSAGIDLVNSGAGVTQGVKALLEGGSLVSIRGRKAEITQDGFAFILQEANTQVWTLLIYYLEFAEQVSSSTTPDFTFRRS
jgi:transcription initiation factor TFIIH subunit 4